MGYSRLIVEYLEEPVPRVFAVGLSQVETLDRGWVSAQFLLEQLAIEVQIPVIEGQTCKTTKSLLVIELWVKCYSKICSIEKTVNNAK